ncbi:hypothetical protein K435DRAFT_788938 [Dendrothele bispora CBS 962.96]|uniref:Uncharacterized protein n=1 Tax=Dendrothele bispora (strain CBS 962.96) TaxID=1314807 RepID=A0A4S8MV74_DENBC|nr:hypothetical protein K435DRAFT_788938 [Dendrothele bispora CBS 962.96]
MSLADKSHLLSDIPGPSVHAQFFFALDNQYVFLGCIHEDFTTAVRYIIDVPAIDIRDAVHANQALSSCHEMMRARAVGLVPPVMWWDFFFRVAPSKWIQRVRLKMMNVRDHCESSQLPPMSYPSVMSEKYALDTVCTERGLRGRKGNSVPKQCALGEYALIRERDKNSNLLDRIDQSVSRDKPKLVREGLDIVEMAHVHLALAGVTYL